DMPVHVGRLLAKVLGRVQGGVAQELPCVAVEDIGAALGLDYDGAGAHQRVLGTEVVLQRLHFRDLVGVGRNDVFVVNHVRGDPQAVEVVDRSRFIRAAAARLG